MRIFFTPIFIAASFLFVFPFVSVAQVGPMPVTGGSQSVGSMPVGSSESVGLINPLGEDSGLEDFLNDILAFVVRIGAIVVVLMLVYTGYKFVAARGAPTDIADARQMLLWTIVGALILLGAQAIAYGIQATVEALSVGN